MTGWLIPQREPVIRPGQLHSPYDDARAGAAHVLEIGDTYRLVYWGTDGRGKHHLLQVSIDSPSTSVTTLDHLTVTLAPGSREKVARIAVIAAGTSSGFDPSGTELGAVDHPSSETINFAVNTALLEGTNQFWLTIEPKRWAALGSTIDGQVDQVVFSGLDAGTVVPADGDPSGVLTLGVVPMSVDIRTRGAHGLSATYRIPGIASDNRGWLHAVYDNRYNFGGDLPGDVDVGYSRSKDGGMTWEPQQVILDFDASVPGSSGNGVGDPCILWDPATDTIWVAALWSFGNNAYHGSGPGTEPAETGQYVLTRSTDGGDTWSAPINITVDCLLYTSDAADDLA